MEILEKHLEKVRIPSSTDVIYKDECFYSFDTPESPGGLLVCLFRFLGFGEEHVKEYIKRTGCCLFLRLRRLRVRKEKGPTATKVSRLAIGEPGGFTPESAFEESSSLVLFSEDGSSLLSELPSEDPSLPQSVQTAVKGILSADSAFKRKEMEKEANKWDGELLLHSKFAQDLKQVDSPSVLPHSGWKCQKCELTNNLWLNLTTGAVLCGRKNFDGSGGNNHAVQYYAETKHPLAVKLGTVTKEGKADVYSYPEDNMVIDPLLKEHLAHFGLKMELLDKTDKSMVEMEIDMNQRIGEWATLTESGSKLVPLFGPGYTGLQSLGNTCYLNSVMQVLMSIPQVATIYESAAKAEFEKVRFDASFVDNLDYQLCRLTQGLCSGKYSTKPPGNVSELDADETQPGIRPTLFKDVVGNGHPDFSGSQQQDAQMFFLHFLTILEQKSKLEFPGHCLQFEVEDRIECGSSGRVKYIHRVEDYLPLPIPLSAATNTPEVDAYLSRSKEDKNSEEPIVRPIIPFDSCVKAFSEEEIVLDFRSSALKGESTIAKKTMRLQTFPDYLFLQMKKFDANPVTHQPYKLNVEVLMPEEIDLSSLRAKGGLQPGEVLLEEEEEAPEERPDDVIVSALADMGFSLEGCKKAAVLTKNAGVEAAMNWVMEHMEDPDFNEPLRQKKGNATFAPESLSMVTSMGFSEAQAAHALGKTEGNVERAVEWIFSHPDEEISSGEAPPKKPLTDGEPKYRLQAFISHMGTSHMVGHYVCHIKKEDQWVIFNDNKVALSENPPQSLAYLYLYKRI